VHLLAAFDPASRVVRGQTQVDGKSNELTAFVPLLDRIDLTDVLLTADALHTQRGMPSTCMIAFGEDLFQIRAGSGPAVMATLRNFAVSRHRLTGDINIAPLALLT
jgi:predicted transposase YbfD/YdcC